MGLVTKITGFLLLLASCGSFSVLMIWMIGAKLIWGEEQNSLLRFMQNDKYYCFLIPMMIPMTFAFVYGNWVSMKFFRHN